VADATGFSQGSSHLATLGLWAQSFRDWAESVAKARDMVSPRERVIPFSDTWNYDGWIYRRKRIWVGDESGMNIDASIPL
jgi:hypothetical protein